MALWVVYAFISYLILALMIPTVWALWPTWRRARIGRQLTCPILNGPALVMLDPWYAVRMHAVGNQELRVKDCARWLECQSCAQECLAQIGSTA